MAVSKAAIHQDHLLPDRVEETFKRWCIQFFGMALFTVAVLGWLCLLSWSINDPSLNNATSTQPNNLLGLTGASFADLLFQFLGLASILFFLPLAAWGWHCMAYHFPSSSIMRIIAWPISVLVLAGTISTLPKPDTWPLPLGLGGILGDAALVKLPTVLNSLHLQASTELTSFILLTIGLPLLLFSLAIRLQDFAILFNVEGFGIKAALLGIIGWFIHVGFEIRNFFLEIAQRYNYERNARKRANLQHHQFGGAAAHMNDVYQQADDQHHKAPKVEQWQPPKMFNDYPKFSNYDTDEEEDLEYENEENELAFNPEDRLIDYAEKTEDHKKNGFSFSSLRFATHKHKKSTSPQNQAKKIKPPARFVLPTSRLLNRAQPLKNAKHLTREALLENAHLLQEVLSDFGVHGEVNNIHAGPVVTLYEFEPARGTKSARVIGLANDIARSMSAISARVAVVPGRNAIGIELPNETRETVFLREIFETREFTQTQADLPLALGKTISGDSVIIDLARMPHMLVAGTTGSGKSVGINAMILSLLFRLPPDKCKFIMIDPKMLELSVYDGIPHLLSPVVTDPKKAVTALKWTVQEMEERYKKMSKLNVRNISGYNDRVQQAIANGEVLSRTVQTGFDKETGQAIYQNEDIELETMPYIVVIIDEMADLMMVAGKDIEATVQRLAQMARAAGIHLIMATQRPSVDVITGTIKANFPSRISYQVSSKIDSRTIIGEQGAEQLLGAGDMLYMANGGRITRAHGPFVSDEEIEKVVDVLKNQGVPEYIAEITKEEEQPEDTEQTKQDAENSLYDKAVDIILRDKKVSISYVQRRLSIGYNKAATLIEQMEHEGLISPPNRSGRRDILVN
ncbi:MAG: DNA translocase FtsK [Pseudomonadota bacterium]